ncbi:hypothetical protein DFH11DRAFT_186305 [Phellopilus nigrolimitatus]|nr:hypothetical protein DFH11DRAFT_186305 [Phellopilus nigrolimitatus]
MGVCPESCTDRHLSPLLTVVALMCPTVPSAAPLMSVMVTTKDHFDILSAATGGMVMRYSAVATMTLCVYEFFLTLDDEKRLVWPSRFTAIKALFLANRYLPFSITFSNAFFLILNKTADAQLCKPALIAIGFMSFSGFILAEVVLAMRVFVIWQARRSILIIVSCLLGAKTTTAFIVTYYYLTSARGLFFSAMVALVFNTSGFDAVSPINLFHSGCEAVFEKRIEWITIFVVFFFEIAILSLMIIAKRAHLRRSRSELVAILVKDGILYCICIMAVSLVNVFVVKLAPPFISPFLVVTQGTLHNILCTRLLLRLRSADERRLSGISQGDGHIIPLVATNSSRTTVSQSQ